MVISAELHAQILRYYHVEKWRAGTIARQIGVHRDVVARVLAQSGLPAHGPMQRPMRIDPYLPFILKTLEAFPTLTAARLYAMVYERGYRGSPDHFRHLIARHRPRPNAEAYLRLRALPGEEAQVDWGHPPPSPPSLLLPSLSPSPSSRRARSPSPASLRWVPAGRGGRVRLCSWRVPPRGRPCRRGRLACPWRAIGASSRRPRGLSVATPWSSPLHGAVCFVAACASFRPLPDAAGAAPH